VRLRISKDVGLFVYHIDIDHFLFVTLWECHGK
jgi:hypothetical protein